MQSRRWCTVYPHTWGKHVDLTGAVIRDLGLPPYVGETPATAWLSFPVIRFTPIRGGNTRVRTCRRQVTPVYPHTWGKHSGNRIPARNHRGLPPYVGETPLIRWQRVGAVRFTPIRGGNTGFFVSDFRNLPVYPHTWGKHCAGCNEGRGGCGLPPYVGETPDFISTTKPHIRFTPIRGGNTPD